MAVTLTDYTEQCERENGGVEAIVVLDKCNRGAYTIVDGVITALATANGTKAYTWTSSPQNLMITEREAAKIILTFALTLEWFNSKMMKPSQLN